LRRSCVRRERSRSTGRALRRRALRQAIERWSGGWSKPSILTATSPEVALEVARGVSAVGIAVEPELDHQPRVIAPMAALLLIGGVDRGEIERAGFDQVRDEAREVAHEALIPGALRQPATRAVARSTSVSSTQLAPTAKVSAITLRPARAAQSHRLSCQRLDLKAARQCGDQHHPCVGDRSLVVELHLQSVQSERPVIVRYEGDLLSSSRGWPKQSLSSPFQEIVVPSGLDEIGGSGLSNRPRLREDQASSGSSMNVSLEMPPHAAMKSLRSARASAPKDSRFQTPSSPQSTSRAMSFTPSGIVIQPRK